MLFYNFVFNFNPNNDSPPFGTRIRLKFSLYFSQLHRNLIWSLEVIPLFAPEPHSFCFRWRTLWFCPCLFFGPMLLHTLVEFCWFHCCLTNYHCSTKQSDTHKRPKQRCIMKREKKLSPENTKTKPLIQIAKETWVHLLIVSSQTNSYVVLWLLSMYKI